MDTRTLVASALALAVLPAWAEGPAGSFGAPMSAAELAGLRGGTATFNDMRLDGTTADNDARNVQTGTNTITEGAFANASGLPIVIQNSGANVLIQNAVIVNVQMR